MAGNPQLSVFPKSTEQRPRGQPDPITSQCTTLRPPHPVDVLLASEYPGRQLRPLLKLHYTQLLPLFMAAFPPIVPQTVTPKPLSNKYFEWFLLSWELEPVKYCYNKKSLRKWRQLTLDSIQVYSISLSSNSNTETRQWGLELRRLCELEKSTVVDLGRLGQKLCFVTL